MNPEIEQDYRELIEQAEAHFGAEVQWAEDGRLRIRPPDDAGPTPREMMTFAERWLTDLRTVRERELAAMWVSI
jgi:hypothetical protein